LTLISGCGQKKSKTIKQTKNKTQKNIKTEKRAHKAFRDLTYDERKEVKERLIAEGRKETAIKHIEKMIPLSNNIQELRNLYLEIADLVFETGQLAKAEQLYSQFSQLYPGDAKIEYATYKSILCGFWLTLNPQRDQSKTKKTIEVAKTFLKRTDIFKQYIKEVEKILADSQQKLFDSEVSIFNDYLMRGDLLSAGTRLKNIEKEFLDDMPHIEPELILLTCNLAEKKGDSELLKAKQDEMQAKFPDYNEIITVVKNSRTSYIDKF